MTKRLLTFEREDPRADVLVVTSGWPNEDNPTYCVFIKRQMESLIDRGLHCDVLFIRGYRSAFAYVLAALRLAYWSVFRRRRYRLVHTHSGEAALAAGFYRRAPLLVSYLGDDVLGRPRAEGGVSVPHRLRRAMIRQQSRLARRTITKSREMELALPRRVQARNSVIPNGVDVDLFKPLDRAAARRELGWDPDARIVLFAADRAVTRKRYWLAERAVANARAQLADLELKVAERIAPDRMPMLMNAADCLLLTSSLEGSPNVVKEALMCNLPVVSTRVGDVAELLDGVVPSLVSTSDEDALAHALVECLLAPRRSNGRQVAARLDERVVADSLLAVYAEIAPTVELRPDESAVVAGADPVGA